MSPPPVAHDGAVKAPTFQTLSSRFTANHYRHFMNLWPPFLFSSIRIERISEDFREYEVRMALRAWSRNYVGTQFGGSLFAMCDPFWMIGTLRALGEKDYIVWDKAGEIEYVSPGRSAVRTTIRIDDALLAQIRQATAGGEKHLVWCENDILAEDGSVVARYRKQLYIRRKPPKTGRSLGTGRAKPGRELPPADA